jgi:hypothetical protein
MSASVKSTIKGGVTKTKEQPSKKKKKNSNKQIIFANLSISSSSSSPPSSSTTHQQHHSAPPSHNQQPKAGLDAIHENGEYEQQQQQQQNSVNNRFPRSSTVPYPAYATVRKTAGNSLPSSHYYFTDNGTFVHETISPAQLNTYYNTRQPFSLINTNFQPISPHHHQYGTRPVDILKPTFLIVPKAAKQRLNAQLSASNSPTSTNKTKSSPTKSMTKKTDIKSPQKSIITIEKSPSTVRNIENQTNNQSPTKTTMDIGHKHIGLIATPNPSPYVHFVNVTSPTQLSQERLPDTSIIQSEFTNLNDYNQTSTSMHSMPNISLTQGKNFFFFQ